MSEIVPTRQETSSRMLWIQLLAGPVLWSLHFLLSYLLVGPACQAGSNFGILGMSGLSFIVFVPIWGVGFTAVILVVLLGLNLGALRAHFRIFNRQQTLVTDVIGHQWWWEIQYPEQGFETANEIHIPIGQPVTLRLSTKDVIHSLGVSELSCKLDLLPNQVNEMVILADTPEEYWGKCLNSVKPDR